MIFRILIYIVICCIIYSIFFKLFSFLYKKIEKIDDDFYQKRKKEYSETKKQTSYYNQQNKNTYYQQKTEKKYIPPKKEEKKEENILPECFKVLGFTKKPISVEEVKTRYKKLAKIYHPDMGGTEEEFQNIEKAYKEALLFYK